MCTFPDPFVHIPLVYTCTWMLLGPPASSAALLIALLISFLIKGRLSVRRVCCLPRQKGGVEGGADRIHLLLRIFRPWFMALFSFSKSRERHKHVSVLIAEVFAEPFSNTQVLFVELLTGWCLLVSPMPTPFIERLPLLFLNMNIVVTMEQKGGPNSKADTVRKLALNDHRNISIKRFIDL